MLSASIISSSVSGGTSGSGDHSSIISSISLLDRLGFDGPYDRVSRGQQQRHEQIQLCGNGINPTFRFMLSTRYTSSRGETARRPLIFRGCRPPAYLEVKCEQKNSGRYRCTDGVCFTSVFEKKFPYSRRAGQPHEHAPFESSFETSYPPTTSDRLVPRYHAPPYTTQRATGMD